ncbi:hypothetical protein CLAFUW4_08812 [Fulvia fulva]|uniref:Uncharacterized protein n=1 Tax=Passalora fulva TaxID=5499 RepID=A0A9Q8PGJ7_PASFU|nr:uncharacterized protein CLAFUR5_08919 [Fulvia fulva]KAK4613642.1 hypothetical protein CLAFUR4_08818 [Fulvia fulva]KAK4614444.1 hypothetical protein CLAFUR0_08810 [Fulvia fulva]UJO22110.1 hypothetical protein CLAFUR5_08919 [Fulvia fulva]WPV20418.1 hypothetical protein CLAFUW4_08812 [Fulvia fulva]WPV35347.1 hypothetical protein CLAFUW7_08813 [Fulvia fulva]
MSSDGTLWSEKMKTLQVRCRAKYEYRQGREPPAFTRLSEVLALVVGPQVKEEVVGDQANLPEDADAGRTEPEIERDAQVKQEFADGATAERRPADAVRVKQELREVQVKQETRD